jgi:hypothetical protein
MEDLFIKRRKEELREMEQLSKESSWFEFTATGSPPEKYEVVFHCKGLVGFDGDDPIIGVEHRAEIILHETYPVGEDSFSIHWKTSIYHPNIDRQNGPCIKGTPLGEGIHIADICEFLAEMVQFIRYNIGNCWKSQTSQEARAWTESHPDKLPLDTMPLRDRAETSTAQG